MRLSSRVLVEALAAAELVELDEDADAGDPAAQRLDEVDRRSRGAAGGEHVIDNENRAAAVDGVTVDLERVGAVLELVFL